VKRYLLVPNRYFDSVTLLTISSKVRDVAGISAATVVMATPANIEQAIAVGLDVPQQASPNDLLVSVSGETLACDTALALVDDLLAERRGSGAVEETVDPPRSLGQAVRRDAGAQLALISVPGAFAAAEAAKALRLGLHAMIFSDNVTLEDEVALKTYGTKRGLLVMGPDCGTAIVNGVPLGFANAVRRGPIGVVGASGTGIQEVTSLIHRMGSGISQAIGTGGRDLSETVGGLSMLAAMRAMDDDLSTTVLVLISKPPAPNVLARIVAQAQRLRSPVVAVFLGVGADELAGTSLHVASTLAQAAQMAVSLCVGHQPPSATSTDDVVPTLVAAAGRRPAARTRLFGGFCGGTFCYEAQIVLAGYGIRVRSNTPTKGNLAASNVDGRSKEDSIGAGGAHLVLDFGSDEYTVGRPHPMIDPTQRDNEVARSLSEASTAVVLFDVVLGHGSAIKPIGRLVDLFRENRDRAEVSVIAQVCGTEGDIQDRAAIVDTLRAQGVFVAESNAQAATWAAAALGCTV
jgi:succinyl-CoA synthetase alpha subunit